jgi:hypothetical protein
MDIGPLTAFLAPYLRHLLDDTVPPLPERQGWEQALRIWSLIASGVENQPDSYLAVRRLAESPDDAGAAMHLQFHLGRLLEQPALAAAVADVCREENLDSLERARDATPHIDLEPGSERIGGVDVRKYDSDPAESAQEPETGRWLHAAVEADGESVPLAVSQPFMLSIDVRLEKDDAVPLTNVHDPGEDEVLLTIVLFSQDFTVETPDPQRLRVPRQGPSRNKARFDLTPRHEGDGEVIADVYKQNNFVQSLVIRLRTGGSSPVIDVASRGRPVACAFGLRRRSLSMTIRRTERGFQFSTIGALRYDVELPITPDQLGYMLTDARNVLRKIVGTRVGSRMVYEEREPIPEAVHRDALQRVAEIGFLLYRALFYDHGDPTAKELGDQLKALAHQEPLQIQIVSREFFLPWAMLYLADEYDQDQVDPELFLGFRHVIEHIPDESPPAPISTEIDSQPQTTISFNLDLDIDQEMRLGVVQEQLGYSAQLEAADPAIQVVRRRTADEVRAALAAEGTTQDKILYFYCHAATSPAPDSSYLRLSDGSTLTLRDLKLRAPTGRAPLPGGPLVFLNACRSTELSPLFYSGFLPYFIRKGARGVIGTECDVPAIFAAEWARRFFNLFLAGGRTIGEVLLYLRRDFLERERNMLGLIYALYCDADTQLRPGLRMPPPQESDS